MLAAYQSTQFLKTFPSTDSKSMGHLGGSVDLGYVQQSTPRLIHASVVSQGAR